MNLYKCLSKTKAAAVWISVLSAMGALFIFSEECKNGAVNGILLCLGVLIPSLFPFFIISSFIAESGVCQRLSKVFDPIAKLLMGTSGICLVPVVLSLVGGYPVGARATAAMYKKGSININESRKLACICCSAGPGFLVTYIGVSLLNSKESSIILLCSQIISVLILCIASKIIFGKSKNDSHTEKICANRISLSEALVLSVNSAVKSAAGMCGFVIAFSVLCSIITEGFAIESIWGKTAIAMLEITLGVNLISGKTSLEIISALTGFGGICVHLQIFRELKGIEFSKARFYIFRCIQSAVCFLATKILLLIFPVSSAVFSSVSEKPALSFYSSIIGCCALIASAALFIITTTKRKHTT